MASPMEIIAHSADENRRSWDQWDAQQNQQNFERGMAALSANRAASMQGVKQAGEEKLEQMRNAGGLERVKAQVQGYIDRLDEKQKGKDLAKWKALGIVPKPGEDSDEFLARAAVEHGQRVAGQANTIWGEIQRREQQANAMMNQEQSRLASLAVQRAKAQFAPSLDVKLQPLLNSQSVEQVIAKLPPKQQGSLKAQWEQILEAEQQKARTEFSPNVSSQIQMIKYGIDQMQKRHSDIIGSNPFAAEFLKFDLPEAPKSFDEALAAAGKSKGTAATSNPAASATADPSDWSKYSQFMPSALMDPAKLAAVQKYHPKGAAAVEDPKMIGTTREAIQKKLERDHATVSGLGVEIGHTADGRMIPIVPKSETVTMPFGDVGAGLSPWGMPPKMVARDLSPAERQARYEKAMQTLSGMSEAANALQLLTPPSPQDQSDQEVLSGAFED